MKETPTRVSLQHATHLGQEDDEGSVEYKWKLVGITPDRFEHLLSQMKFRVTEGQGECIYEVGVADDGLPKGLAESDFLETLATLRRMADRLQCDLSVVYEKVVQESPLLKCAEVMVRKFGLEDVVDVRISMCGHAGSGKSTLVGVLTTGVLDTGKGSARQKVFNHLHELETGLTSSISQQILGFGACGDIINYATDQLFQVSLERIAEMSSKVCTLYDLAGHEKYLKTTVTGMTGAGLDYACLVIRADKGIQQMTREHLGLCFSLGIPVFCVVTGADLVAPQPPESLVSGIRALLHLPTGPRQPQWVTDHADVLFSARSVKCGTFVPVFYTSSVTGQNLDLLRTFLNLVPVRREWDMLTKLPAEVVLDRWFAHAAESGMVVSGLIEQGCLTCGDQMLLGPDKHGKFETVVVRSIQVKRVNVKKAEAGIHATYAIGHPTDPAKPLGTDSLRKGMVLAHPRLAPMLRASWRFEADVRLLFAAGKIQSHSFQPVFHCRMIRQKVRLLLLEGNDLPTGVLCRVQFEFLFTAEYLKEGLTFVLLDGSTKAIGTITGLIALEITPNRRQSPLPPARGRCHSSGAERTTGTKPQRPRFFSGRSPPGIRPVAAEVASGSSKTPRSPLTPLTSTTAPPSGLPKGLRVVSFCNVAPEAGDAAPPPIHKPMESPPLVKTFIPSAPAGCPSQRQEKRSNERLRRQTEKRCRKAACGSKPESTEFDVYAD